MIHYLEEMVRPRPATLEELSTEKGRMELAAMAGQVRLIALLKVHKAQVEKQISEEIKRGSA